MDIEMKIQQKYFIISVCIPLRLLLRSVWLNPTKDWLIDNVIQISVSKPIKIALYWNL